MKKAMSFILVAAWAVFLSGCGKPNDAEVLTPDVVDVSGGYKIVRKFETPGYAQDVLKKDTLLYMAQGEGGLLIVNLADPENPEIVSVTTENVRGYSTEIGMKDSVVYLAAGSFGITVVNVADPLAPVVTVSNLNMKPAKSVTLFGNYLFVAVSELGINVAEISYPTQPDVRGGVVTPGYCMAIAITSDTNLMLAACGEMGLNIYNISDFQDGFGTYPRIGWCDTPGYAEELVLDEDHSIAFLACGTSGLQVISYADTNNIHITGSCDEGGYAKDLVYKHGKIFMTVELLGLQVIDVSDITNPYMIGTVDLEFALGIDADDEYIYMADKTEGLIIISIPD